MDDEILELARSCPTCRRAALTDTAQPMPHSACASCGGAFLDREAIVAFALSLRGVEPGALDAGLARGNTSAHTCPSCRSLMRVVPLRGAELDVCTRCRGAWLSAGTLFSLTAGRMGRRSRGLEVRQASNTSSGAHARPSAPELTRRAPARSRAPLLLGAVFIVVVGAGAAAALWRGHTTREAERRATAEAAAAARVPTELLPSRLYGGHSADTWRVRLDRLAALPEQSARYQLTRQRAEAHGLRVEGGPTQHAVREATP